MTIARVLGLPTIMPTINKFEASIRVSTNVTRGDQKLKIK